VQNLQHLCDALQPINNLRERDGRGDDQGQRECQRVPSVAAILIIRYVGAGTQSSRSGAEDAENLSYKEICDLRVLSAHPVRRR
jgi:hypothetical protein